MTEQQLEHLIRSSCAIIGDPKVIVIGSQSILPWLRKVVHRIPDPWPRTFTLSTEADIIPIDNDAQKSDLIDGAIGEGSFFEKTFGVYAQGVSLETAKAPAGWVSRCFPMADTLMNVVGLCMHPADLFIAKTVAGRDKDHAFLDAMIQYELVKKQGVLHLVPKLSGIIPDDQVARIHASIQSRFSKIHDAKNTSIPSDADRPPVVTDEIDLDTASPIR